MISQLTLIILLAVGGASTYIFRFAGINMLVKLIATFVSVLLVFVNVLLFRPVAVFLRMNTTRPTALMLRADAETLIAGVEQCL